MAQLDKIAQEYKNGASLTQLGITHGIDRHKLKKLLQTHGVQFRERAHALYLQDEELVCELYRQGTSSLALGKRFDVSCQTIINILRRRNIPVRGLSPYSLKHPHYFDSIDEEQKAYWLGFLAADGCITGNGTRLQIALQGGDRTHLEKFRGAIGADNPIHDSLVAGKYPTSKLAISSKTLTDGLRTHGLHERKSLTLKWAIIPEHLTSHYMRGYTDGDGGFYVSINKYNGGFNHLFSIYCASMQFLTAFQKALIQACNLPRLRLYKRQDKPDRSRMLAYSGRLQVKRIFDYLYKDATVWLHRKRDKIEPYLVQTRPGSYRYGR